ncbi:hypothetical protein [Nocardia sp. NPDC050793]|uniref:hypothetical protein n=1 Tax=Nocardia sp. NPDC050793 TaxID=3155159 RepID=UPI0033F67C7A
MSDEMTTILTTTPDGLETEDAGVLIGEVELRSTVTDDGQASAHARYPHTEQWHTISGATRHLDSPAHLAIYHTQLVAQHLPPEQ